MEPQYEPDDGPLTDEQIEAMRQISKPPSKLKGRKCEPKYRGPNGETWSGRGKMANFVKEALASGKTLEELKI